MADEGARRSGRVQSVERASALLRAVASAACPRDTTVRELAEACGLHRATAWRILTTLEADGLVRQDRVTGQWAIGPGLLDLVGAYDTDTLVRDAGPVLEQLARDTGETAAIAFPAAGRLRYVEEVEPASIVSVHWKGRTVPLHATSTGKALLAYAGDDFVDSALRMPLEGFTPTTITDPAELRAVIGEDRARGYSVCRGEYEVTAYGVSSAVLDRSGRPLAVLSIWGPRHRLPEERFAELGELVVEGATALSRPRSGASAD